MITSNDNNYSINLSDGVITFKNINTTLGFIRYNEAFKDLPVHVQAMSNGLNHNYHKYVVRFENKDTRKRVKNALNASVHYETPLSANSMYDSLKCRRDVCTASKTASNTVLSLPVHAWLTEDEISTIINTVSRTISNRHIQG